MLTSSFVFVTCQPGAELNDWSFAPHISAFMRQAAEMGLVAPRAKQLPAHRQEVALVGLTRRGARRVDSSRVAG